MEVTATSQQWDCDRAWPEIDLFLPVCLIIRKDYKRRYEFANLFLRSYSIFWSKASNTSLNIIFDSEDAKDDTAIETINYLKQYESYLPGPYRISLNHPAPYYKSGHDRQQWMMFWPENFTKSEYVGYVDTDCVFVTYVDREDVFENGKPVINGRSGIRYTRDAWDFMANSTYYATNLLEPMRCMSYFPVIFKVAHFKGMREWIGKQHDMHFNDFFKRIQEKHNYSQFGIMCTYIWHFHRDEYTWYVHSETPDWDGVHPPPKAGQDGNVTQFTPAMRYPKPRIATHARYRSRRESNIFSEPVQLSQLLQRGMCLSPPFDRNTSVCTEDDQTHRDGFYDEMFRFEYFDWSSQGVNSRDAIKEAHRSRLARFAHCNHTIPDFFMPQLLDVSSSKRRLLRSIGDMPVLETLSKDNIYDGDMDVSNVFNVDSRSSVLRKELSTVRASYLQSLSSLSSVSLYSVIVIMIYVLLCIFLILRRKGV